MLALGLTRQSPSRTPGRRHGPRRHSAAAVLALQVLVGTVVPVVHAQADAGERAATHIEALGIHCPVHNDLACLTCRHLATAAPLSTGFQPVAAPATYPMLAPAQPVSVVRSPVFSSLGARAPPLR
jgi:hypothetical protein